MNFPFYIAKRYLFSKSSNNAINIITVIAALGVVVGAMSLFIVLSGFSGLKEFSLQFTNVVDSDLKIYPARGKTIPFTAETETKLKTTEGIEAHSKILEERIFLQYKGKTQIAAIKGVDTNFTKVTPVENLMYLGDWFQKDLNEVVVGYEIARKLSMGVRDYGNPLEIYVPKPGTGQLSVLGPNRAFSQKMAVVSGIYQINEDIDVKYVYAHIGLARSLLGRDSTQVSHVEIKLKPGVPEATVVPKIKAAFGTAVQIKNRVQQNDALYKMLNTENIAVYLIFTLVVIIALFNVVGSIIMMVLDKRKNIVTLYNLGITIKEARKIFFLQGTLMTALSGVVGILLGVLVVWGQLQFKFIYITPTLPYPIKLNLVNIAVVFGTITVLGVLASKIASGRVRMKLLR
ncbi:MAG: ABC transporter permease [Marinirhabdus sp.]